MQLKHYQWTETADGNEVMGVIRVGGEVFTSVDFTHSQIQHLLGMSFAVEADQPATNQPAYVPTATGENLEAITERLESIYINDGWQAIKTLAVNYGIEKPAGGWDEAIPLIAAAEFKQVEG